MFFDSFIFKKGTLLQLLFQRKTQLLAQINTICHNALSEATDSMSSGVDLTYSTVKWKIAQKIGAFKTYPQRWKDNSVVNMVLSWQPPYPALLIDDGVNDIFIAVNRTLHKNLLQRHIPHDYVERPGRHSCDYWTRVLKYHLLFFKEQFGKRG